MNPHQGEAGTGNVVEAVAPCPDRRQGPAPGPRRRR
jgi:hypothetical protein